MMTKGFRVGVAVVYLITTLCSKYTTVYNTAAFTLYRRSKQGFLSGDVGDHAESNNFSLVDLTFLDFIMLGRVSL